MVLFALLVPVILTIGSVVVSAGNWYVLKRHLQTQADSAALAGGASFQGCGQNAVTANAAIAASALKYSGDTIRSGSPYNLQLEEAGDQRVVLNSTSYWSPGDPTDGSSLDNTLGTPCDTKFLDVKVTDDKAPLLFRWIPLFPSLKTRARIEVHKLEGGEGVRPLGVPEVDPVKVGVLFVNEDAAGGVNAAGAIVGKSFLDWWDPASANPPPSQLDGMSAWHQDVSNINLNGNENYSTVIVASRDPNVSLNGSLSTICNQNPTQTHCYGPGSTLQQGISFIHAYSDSTSGSASAAAIRQVELSGGCGVVGSPIQSEPYFNVDDGSTCGPILIQAKIDFGVSGDPTVMPTCATATASPGGAMTWSPGGIGGALGTWTTSFTPAITSGRNVVSISTQFKRPSSNNCNQRNSGASFPRVAVPYVADDNSGVVQYLRLDNLSSPFGPANSINGTSNASIRVTVGLTPPLRDAQPGDPPIALRVWNTPGQTQALDCGSGSGPNGWGGKMQTGCDPYQIYDQAKHQTGCGSPPSGVPAADPPDCIASQNGNFQQSAVTSLWASPCASTPNNWYTAVNNYQAPPLDDPRWIPLFITDETAFTISGKKYYPIRRFGGFYVTAGSGMNCPGDDPSGNLNGKRSLWGHFVSYIIPTFGTVIPSDQLCSFTDGDACVITLVE